MVSSLGTRSTLGVALVSLLMAGCQSPPLMASMVSPLAVRQSLPTAPLPAPIRKVLQQAPSEEPTDLVTDLNLTDEQRRQLEALPRHQPPDQSSEFRRLILAPQVDAAALRTLMTPTDASMTDSVNAWVAFRNILTPQQRQQVIQKLRQQSSVPAGSLEQSQVPEAYSQRLGLSANQSASLITMNNAFAAAERASQARMQSAIEAFLEAGDAGALQQAMIEDARSWPINTMIAAYSNLTQAQRRQIFESLPGETGAAS